MIRSSYRYFENKNILPTRILSTVNSVDHAGETRVSELCRLSTYFHEEKCCSHVPESIGRFLHKSDFRVIQELKKEQFQAHLD